MRRKLAQAYSDLKFLKLKLPRLEVRPTDCFVISWPRSGNTWLRYMLFHGLYPHRDWDLESLDHAMPSVANPALQGLLPALEEQRFRMFKSHDPCGSYFLRGRVLYLVRDGRDAVSSFYHYRTNLNRQQNDFRSYLKKSLAGEFRYGSWHEHVAGWLDCEDHPSLLVVRYEDMLADPKSILGQVLGHFGTTLSDERLDEAVQRSSVDRVNRGFQMQAAARQRQFSGGLGGGSGRHRDIFGADDELLFLQEAGGVMRRLGYVPAEVAAQPLQSCPKSYPKPRPTAPARAVASNDRVRRLRIGNRTCWVNERAAAHFGLLKDDGALAHMIKSLLDRQARLVLTFKDDRRSLVQLWELNNQSWVVKHYRGPAWKTWCHHMVARTPAWREWRNARRLRRCDLRVVDLMALVHEHRGQQTCQALITPYVDAPNLQQWINRSQDPAGQERSSAKDRRRIAAAVGAQVGTISAAGYANRDHKVSNLLIDRACELGNAGPVIIDPARLKRRSSDQIALRMLALLAWSAKRTGTVTFREQLVCLRAALSADRSLARGRRRRLRYAAAQVQTLLNDFQRTAQARQHRSSTT